MTTLRLGTRKSALAQAQAHWVSDQLRAAVPGLLIEMVSITTPSGDLQAQRVESQPLTRPKPRTFIRRRLKSHVYERNRRSASGQAY